MAGAIKCTGLADAMVVASMVIELNDIYKEGCFDEIIANAIASINRHYDPQRRIFLENVPGGNEDILEFPEARLFSPGHSIEVAWFLLHLLELKDDPQTRQIAYDVIEGSLNVGWDKEFGGLFYFMDLAGRPTLQLESSMKLWWPHTEALYALILAAKHTGEKKYFDWLEKVHDYTYSHFVDEEYGEWFGYCDRRGNLTHTSKGGNYKGCFRVPRFLLMAIQAIDERV
jgi:N-acylglucosamine 2-epimerase